MLSSVDAVAASSAAASRENETHLLPAVDHGSVRSHQHMRALALSKNPAALMQFAEAFLMVNLQIVNQKAWQFMHTKREQGRIKFVLGKSNVELVVKTKVWTCILGSYY